MGYSNITYGKIEQYVDIDSLSRTSSNKLISGYNLYLLNIILSIVKEQLKQYDGIGTPNEYISGVKSLTVNNDLDAIMSYFESINILNGHSYKLYYNYKASSLDIMLYLQFAYNVEDINIETVIGV